MRPINPISIVIPFLIIASYADNADAQLWTFRQSGVSERLNAITFVDSSVGFAVGDHGTVISTTDAGLTWIRCASGTDFNLYGLSFFSRTLGLLVGSGWDTTTETNAGIILRTTDGGRSWSRQLMDTANMFYGISLVDSATGTVVGARWGEHSLWPLGVILRTSDGGTSWIQQFIDSIGSFNAVAFTGVLHGVAAGGRIVRTTDAGFSWESEDSGVLNWIMSLSFSDSDHGIALGELGTIESTADGGHTWRDESEGSNDFEAVSMYSSAQAVAVGGEVLALTSGTGKPWRTFSLRGFHGASMSDANTITLVGDSGRLLRTDANGSPPSRPRLAYPENGVQDQEPTFLNGEGYSCTFRWMQLPYTSFDGVDFEIQVTSDSEFSSERTLSRWSRKFPDAYGRITDTTAIMPGLFPGVKYYWRARAKYSTSYSNWSSVWTFTTHVLRRVTVQQVQAVPADSLMLADSLQNSDLSRWTLQQSPLRDSVVQLVVRCVVPASALRADHQFIIVTDTSSPDSPWSGIMVRGSPLISLPTLYAVPPGTVIHVAGIIREDPQGTFNSVTSLECLALLTGESTANRARPLRASVSDFRRGGIAGGLTMYSSGERFEGTIVELTDLIVDSILSKEKGTLALSDGKGNQLATTDLSSWYTFSAYRNPNSTYSLPPAGSAVDTIRGLITAEATQGSPGGIGYRLAPIFEGDIGFGSRSRGVIRGTVVYDIDHDSIRSAADPGITDWQVELSGTAHSTTLTDTRGKFVFSGLDSGRYHLTEILRGSWGRTFPPTGGYDVTLHGGDTIESLDFGNYFPFNSIAGNIYWDANENGWQDSGEVGLEGWLVSATNFSTDTVRTDSSGRFTFWMVPPGRSDIHAEMQPAWEQVIPVLQEGYSYVFQSYDQHRSGASFGVHHIPKRAKLRITVHDSSWLARRDLWCGVRPGATYGIWGVDSNCTSADFSEGEFELPPLLPDLFDARFLDPHRRTLQFGNGSWTDVRDYKSQTQVDTFLLRFSPSVAYGGDYPMTILWSSDSARNWFYTSAVLIDAAGNATDMSACDSIVITNPDISSLWLICRGPLLGGEMVEKQHPDLPRRSSLSQNYPNPFNPSTDIRYQIADAGFVTLTVYDILGRQAATLVHELKKPGAYSVHWNAAGAASGLYFCRLTFLGVETPRRMYSDVKKMLLVK